MSNPKQQSRKDFEKKIIMKAWDDAAFLEKLRKDPKGVIQDELKAIDPDFTLPDNMKVKIHEEDPNTLHLVVPANPRKVSPEKLSDEQVDEVAAGSVLVAVVVNVAVAVNAQLAANANTAANANALANANVSANANATS